MWSQSLSSIVHTPCYTHIVTHPVISELLRNSLVLSLSHYVYVFKYH